MAKFSPAFLQRAREAKYHLTLMPAELLEDLEFYYNKMIEYATQYEMDVISLEQLQSCQNGEMDDAYIVYSQYVNEPSRANFERIWNDIEIVRYMEAVSAVERWWRL